MRFSVTTPRGSVVETDIDEVTAPGLEGELGVLPEHVPLMAALKPGVLTYRSQGKTTVMAVGEGFLQVAPAPAGGAGDGAGGGGPEGGGGGGGGGGGHADGGAARRAVDRVLVLVDQAIVVSRIKRDAAQQDLARAEGELAAWKQELDGAYQALLARRDWALAQVNATERSAPATAAPAAVAAPGPSP